MLPVLGGAHGQDGNIQDEGRKDRLQEARLVKDDTRLCRWAVRKNLHAASILEDPEVQGAPSHLGHARRKTQSILFLRHLAHGPGSPEFLQDPVPDRVLLPGRQAVLRPDAFVGYGRQQTRLRIQRLFRLAQRGKGHNEGKRGGVFHVILQTADDQLVPDKTNF